MMYHKMHGVNCSKIIYSTSYKLIPLNKWKTIHNYSLYKMLQKILLFQFTYTEENRLNQIFLLSTPQNLEQHPWFSVDHTLGQCLSAVTYNIPEYKWVSLWHTNPDIIELITLFVSFYTFPYFYNLMVPLQGTTALESCKK
jgi:hypothetical protein